MAHAHRPARARHRRPARARALRYRYGLSWLVIMICLDAFFLQGMVSSIRYEPAGDDSGPMTGRGQPIPHRPVPGTSPGSAGRPPGGAARPPPGHRPRPPAEAAPGRRGYRLYCGVVTLAQTARAARLVTVTPRPGWRDRSWNGKGWLRVDMIGRGRLCRLSADWRGTRLTVRATTTWASGTAPERTGTTGTTSTTGTTGQESPAG